MIRQLSSWQVLARAVQQFEESAIYHIFTSDEWDFGKKMWLSWLWTGFQHCKGADGHVHQYLPQPLVLHFDDRDDSQPLRLPCFLPIDVGALAEYVQRWRLRFSTFKRMVQPLIDQMDDEEVKSLATNVLQRMEIFNRPVPWRLGEDRVKMRIQRQQRHYDATYVRP